MTLPTLFSPESQFSKQVRAQLARVAARVLEGYAPEGFRDLVAALQLQAPLSARSCRGGLA